MESHVITFASVGIRDGWIEVTAKNQAIVRAWADVEYRRWSDTTPIEDFGPDSRAFFPLGCLGTVTLHYEDASHVSARTSALLSRGVRDEDMIVLAVKRAVTKMEPVTIVMKGSVEVVCTPRKVTREWLGQRPTHLIMDEAANLPTMEEPQILDQDPDTVPMGEIAGYNHAHTENGLCVRDRSGLCTADPWDRKST